MLSSKLANKLLYVPFNREYSVNADIQAQMTNDEFFRQCYYTPDFVALINKLQDAEDEENTECEELECPVLQNDLICKLQQQKLDENNLVDWIKNNGIGVYAVCGEAGTGKTTYLRHLAYDLTKYNWRFLDMAKATKNIKILNKKLTIPDDSSLIGKTISTTIQEIKRFFVPNNYRGYSNEECKSNICKIVLFFFDRVLQFDPAEELCTLYYNLSNVNMDEPAEAYCRQCASFLYKHFEDLFVGSADLSEIFELLLEHLQILFFASNENTKNIIVFDNIERYVGTDEIYDNQIVSFMKTMRNFTDQYNIDYDQEYTKHFQYIIALRDSTLRFFTPLQIADFLPHRINISKWFPIDEVIDLRIQWYFKHPDLLDDEDKLTISRLNRILSDKGRTGQVIRGLRLKLSMLFNDNKRLLLDYILSLLEDVNNRDYLRKADALMDNKSISFSNRKFAYRSIIWRIVCDRLQQDALFKSIESAAVADRFRESTTPLNYIRRLLTILSNQNTLLDGTPISLTELLSKLYKKEGDIKTWFFDRQCEMEREKIAYSLYILNYCNRHENHWLRFVNILCSNDSINKIQIKCHEDFKNNLLREDVFSYISIQITSAGIAYLGYIVQTFEQLSSVLCKKPPLFTAIPTEKELLEKNTDELQCISIIREVGKKSSAIRRSLDGKDFRKYEIGYLKKADAPSISYSQRLKNAHSGFVGNYHGFIEEVFMSSSEEVKEKAKALTVKIGTLTNLYY